MIGAKRAWEILHKYAEDCQEIDSESLLAIFATGSLPAGYYRPGQSDIDAVLIVKVGSQDIWGNSEMPGKRLAALNRAYLDQYKIPKDFGPFPLSEAELFPPYDPENDLLTLEIARLKVQGQLIFGNYDVDLVPMPSPNDFLVGAKAFEAWWDQEFLKTTPLESMSSTACVNTILMHLSRFLIIQRSLFEFNKWNMISTYLSSNPPVIDEKIFFLVNAYLQGQMLTSAEIERIRSYTPKLRIEMNEILGISG